MKRSNLQKMASIDKKITDIESKISVVQDTNRPCTVTLYHIFSPSPIIVSVIRLMLTAELEQEKLKLLHELEELNNQ